MAHEEQDVHLSQEEKRFREFYQRAEDLRKIQLLRYAKYWYEQALLFNMESGEVQSRLDETNEEIRKETRIIITIVAVTAVIIAGVLLFR